MKFEYCINQLLCIPTMNQDVILWPGFWIVQELVMAIDDECLRVRGPLNHFRSSSVDGHNN